MGSAFKAFGDFFYRIGFDWAAQVCYEAARKRGAKLEWGKKAKVSRG